MSYFYDIKEFTMLKTELFTGELRQLAKFTKVLSHPARLAILQYLAETKSCISGDISDYIPLSRSTVSQHLKELKEFGLIKGEIEGPRINYCLCGSKISEYKKLFDLFLCDMTRIDPDCDSEKVQNTF
jgi:ArsR family transcriptional regulator, arsenate/arsenite/antimonite-responsive transcriptional repressor